MRAAPSDAANLPVPFVIDLQHSAHVQVRALPYDAVEWTSGFWADRFHQLHDTTLPELWRLLADPEAGHVLDNFRYAAKPGTGKFAGTNWQDEWLYKWIEGAACVWRTTRDPWIDERMDEGIALIAAAQQPDGYLSTNITVRQQKRFTNANYHELYNMGHLLTAAVVHHRMTGKNNLLEVGIRAADYLVSIIGVTVPPDMAHNPSVLMGLVELYRLTGNRHYLDCASLIVDTRGTKPVKSGSPDPRLSIAGTDLIQDRVPIRDATEMVGQNVFSTYLYTGAGDVLAETGDPRLAQGLVRLWDDLTEHKMYIHGGISAMAKGVSHNMIVHEAVGARYDLPNSTGYNETCGQIGCFMWGYRLLTYSAEGRFADVMEREMYNGFLGGLGLDGKSWFYRNVLRRYDANYEPANGSGDIAETDMSLRSQPGKGNICCPSNLLRTVAELSSYFYGADDHGLWVHQYGGSRVRCPLPGHEEFVVEQITDYPNQGEIRFVVQQAPAQPVALHLRIPAWANSHRITLNGETLQVPVEHGYAALSRNWNNGDVVVLNLPLEPTLIEGNPNIESTRNQIAVTRGPLVYCAESIDLPAGVDISALFVPSDCQLHPTAPGLPGASGFLAQKIVTLTGEAYWRPESAWQGLYRPIATGPMRSVTLRLIPYYAWSNRGRSAMSVWLPTIPATR